ncbi:hypothetical protein AB5J72_22500 [Streptomyces sp. CG1]|uniref:hypothetical protein n=1 Tax=unclassified Streptomyces TaxID=2593676 RepID=UPI00096EE6FE|nr:hypothetical protein [Streptomyces sp. IMTB 2501]OLZ71489.1 hypothetical protein AV521_11165 [Streptomyces sp. IMTB 2501]
MMKKLLATAVLALSVAALAAPAHADDRELDTDSVTCTGNLNVLPVLQPTSPLALAAGAIAAVPVCGAGSTLSQLHG